MRFHHKNIRLAPENYVGKQYLFITLCCAGRRNFFTNPKVCDWFLQVLRRDATWHLFAVHAYCIMPDHVHLLLEGLEPTSDLLQFVKALKRKSSGSFLRRTGQRLWQKKFYDHILRRSDSPDAVAWYIWMNPVRAGICQQPQDYPYLGSFTAASLSDPGSAASWAPAWGKQKRPRKSGAATLAGD